MIALAILPFLFAITGALVFRSFHCSWMDSVAISFGSVAVMVDLWAAVWLIFN